jgi:hypothetical protein
MLCCTGCTASRSATICGRYPISAICNFVNNPNFAPEHMPAVLVVLICDLADATYPPLTDRTYQGGARYVETEKDDRLPSGWLPGSAII